MQRCHTERSGSRPHREGTGRCRRPRAAGADLALRRGSSWTPPRRPKRRRRHRPLAGLGNRLYNRKIMGRNEERVWFRSRGGRCKRTKQNRHILCSKRDNMCYRSRNQADITQGVANITNARRSALPCNSSINSFSEAATGNQISVLAAGLFLFFGGQIGTEDTEVSFEPKLRPINPKVPYHTHDI